MLGALLTEGSWQLVTVVQAVQPPEVCRGIGISLGRMNTKIMTHSVTHFPLLVGDQQSYGKWSNANLGKDKVHTRRGALNEEDYSSQTCGSTMECLVSGFCSHLGFLGNSTQSVQFKHLSYGINCESRTLEFLSSNPTLPLPTFSTSASYSTCWWGALVFQTRKEQAAHPQDPTIANTQT